jgi:ElaB/YqjD/DUF883 family membrane-anchored ribosome-binding protein
MATAVVEARETAEAPSFRGRVVDAYRQAGHLSHEARLLKRVAEDTIEDGLYAAKRAAKAIGRRVEGLSDEAAYRVKQQPLQAVGVAVGVGVVFGLAMGWVVSRLSRPRTG